jgi:hypothetical protein
MLLVGVLVCGSTARAEISIRQNEKGDVVSISGLATPEGCHPFEMRGVVVKREFREDEMVLSGLIIEAADGTRTFVNVLALPESLNLAARGNLIQGLQRFGRVGRTVSTVIYACGAGGRTLFLDAIK